MELNEKFVLKSRAIVGNILSILVALSTLGYISFTQEQAVQWELIAVALSAISSNGLGIIGRLKAKDSLYFFKEEK